MKELTVYRSENKRYIFESQEECNLYNAMAPEDFTDCFLEVGNFKFKILKTIGDEEKKDVVIYLETLAFWDGEGYEGFCEFNLWKVSFTYSNWNLVYEMKESTSFVVVPETGKEGLNICGWYPRWQHYLFSLMLKERTLENIMKYIENTLKEYAENKTKTS